MVRNCCVLDCRNNEYNSNYKFYKFPTTSWKLEQRKRWIAAVKRKNEDGSPWKPKPHNTICSAHFVGGKKSEEEASPSYVPIIFGSVKVDEAKMLEEYERFKAEKLKKVTITEPSIQLVEEVIKMETSELTMIDNGCQANIYSDFKCKESTFTCNRYIFGDYCDAEIQVEIATNSKNIVNDFLKSKDKGCNTDRNILIDKMVVTESQNVLDISIFQNDTELMDFAGVTFNTFEFLLSKIKIEKCLISSKNRLLIFCLKLKSGLTFSTISVLFGVHRTTISRIFHSVLKDLVSATADLIFWLDKTAAQAIMPKYFCPTYANTRVIIDCIELKIEIPAQMVKSGSYSPLKAGFTAKVLLGITPGGFVCFKSKVVSGKITESQLTLESGLIDYLETKDIVLVGKDFPAIKKVLDDSGKEAKIFMLPLLKDQTEFSQEKIHETHEIAQVKFHAEKMMQQLKFYKIFDKIPHNLFNCIDDLVHMCCVLVNLQTSVFLNKNQI